MPELVAVASSNLAPPGLQLLGHISEGDSLCEVCPGLRADWSGNPFLDASRLKFTNQRLEELTFEVDYAGGWQRWLRSF